MRHRIFHAPVSPSTPNHMILPVIIYQQTDVDFEQTFSNNQWKNIWVNGVFDYHHFHPNIHEVLGVKSGQAEIMLGGENGQSFTVSKGDALLLPAGYGHRLISKSDDFTIVGAYPTDDKVETLTQYDDLKSVNSAINSVHLPDTDPICGNRGPMFEEWHNLYSCSTVPGSR